MIHIAIIDPNKIYRDSLKMVLEQVDEFRVVIELSGSTCDEIIPDIPVQLMILDSSIGKEKCNELIRKVSTNALSVKTLVLAMFREELLEDYDNAVVILKSSGKTEFINRIRMITSGIDERTQ